MSQPKIRHLAIVSLDPEKLAKFYEETFEMKRLRAEGNAIYMTDGYITLALLQNKAQGKPSGINHFGFHVENPDEITRRMANFGIDAPGKRPADRPFAETRGTDPDGNNIDISVHGFEQAETAHERAKKKEPVSA